MSVVSLESISPRMAPWPREVRGAQRVRLLLTAIAELLWMDVCKAIGYGSLRRRVARVTVSNSQPSPRDLDLVRMAVRDMCILYFKPVHCLQRSAAVTRMLRRRGFAAELVVGYQPMPINSHAWVELDGRVIWDHMTHQAFFCVVDRI